MDTIEQSGTIGFRAKVGLSLLAATMMVFAGCGGRGAVTNSGAGTAGGGQLSNPGEAAELPYDPATPVILEGFELNIAFLGAPNLNTQVRVRPDGKISLPLIGEVDAVGLTPVELKEKLQELYAPELISTEMVITLTSAAFPVYITGAVGRNGEILCNRPTTAFELVMRAGVNLQMANLRRVVVIRRENDEPKRFELNLELVLDGKEPGLFFLKPGDTVYVPERII